MSSEQTIHRRFTVEQIDALRDASHDIGGNLADRNEVLVVILADFGLRANEARQLKRSHFRLAENQLLLPGDVQKDYPKDSSLGPKSTIQPVTDTIYRLIRGG